MLIDIWNYIAESFQITGVIYLCVTKGSKDVVLSDEHDHYEWMSANQESFEKIDSLFRPQMQ